jgi:hypothetical protein
MGSSPHDLRPALSRRAPRPNPGARSPASRSRRTRRSRSRRCGPACAISRRPSRCCPGTSRRTARTAPRSSRRIRVDYLLWKRPSKEWSSFQFRETLTHWALRWGNGYAEIEPTRLGRPFALWPIHPERVRSAARRGRRVDELRHAIEAGDLYYEVDTARRTQGRATCRREHVPYPRLRRRPGRRQRDRLRRAVARLGAAAQLFGAAFFGNGMNPAGVVINKKPLKPDGLKRQKAEFEQLYKGPNNANRPRSSTTMPTGSDRLQCREAQLIDVHQYLVEEHLPLVRRAAAQGDAPAARDLHQHRVAGHRSRGRQRSRPG